MTRARKAVKPAYEPFERGGQRRPDPESRPSLALRMPAVRVTPAGTWIGPVRLCAVGHTICPEAYRRLVRAVEHAAAQVVIPSDPQPKLAKIRGDGSAAFSSLGSH